MWPRGRTYVSTWYCAGAAHVTQVIKAQFNLRATCARNWIRRGLQLTTGYTWYLYRVWDMETAGEFRIRKGFEGREDESEYLISI